MFDQQLRPCNDELLRVQVLNKNGDRQNTNFHELALVSYLKIKFLNPVLVMCLQIKKSKRFMIAEILNI